MSSKFLKKKNIPTITVFIIWCLAMYAVFFTGWDSFFVALQGKFTTLSAKQGLAITMMPVLMLILSGVVSSEWKATLVFWRVKNPLPGHRAFSRLAPNEPRIDMALLRKKVVNWPKSNKEQNAAWYKIYKKHESAVTVENAHRYFLLARDLCTISLLFGVGGGIGLLAAGVKSGTVVLFVSVMLVQYALLAIVARNHGNRFVCNVLVEHSVKA